MKILKLSGGHESLVDDEDYDRIVALGTWHLLKDNRKTDRTRYVRKTEWTWKDGIGTSRTILLHRFILGVEGSRVKIDHKDGNGLNNQKSNLRLASQLQNTHNMRKKSTHGYKGIKPSWKKWQATIRANGVPLHLGTFPDKISAALAYDAAARKYFGEFARCNFPAA